MRVPLSTVGLRTTQARQTVQADAGAFGADVAQGIGHVGQAASQINARISARNAKIQQEKDAADALEAYTRASDTLRDRLRGDGGFLNLEGREAAEGYDQTQLDVDEIGTRHADGLSDNARIAYERLWRGRRESALNSAATHSGNQRKAYLKSSSASVAEQSQLDAIESYTNPQSVAEHLERGELAIRAGNAGQPADAVALEVQKYRSSSALSAITAAVDSGDFGAARALQESFGDQLAGQDGSTAAELIERAGLVERRQEATDQIHGQFGANEAAAREYIRENYSGELEDEILRDYEGRVKENRISETAQKEQVLEQALAAVDAGTPVDSLPISQYRALTEEDRKYLRRRQSGAPAVTDWEAYAEYAELSAGELRELDLSVARRRLNDQDFRALAKRKQTALGGGNNDGDIESSRTLSQAIDQYLVDSGITDKKKRKGRQGQIHSTYDQRYQAYQQEHGREPDDAWRDEQLKLLIAETVISRPGDIWGRDTQTVRAGVPATLIDLGIPQEHSSAVLSAFGGQAELRGEEIKAYYDTAIERYRTEVGVEDPTPEQIEAAIVRMRWEREQANANEQQPAP